MLWRFRGTPHYLGQQASRLGVTPVLADRARNNQEIYRVSVLLAQLCERYHKARKEDGRPVLPMTELAQVRGTLLQAEQECTKLHALAATAADHDRRSLRGFLRQGTGRHFAVLCDFDTPSVPLPCRRRDGRGRRRRPIVTPINGQARSHVQYTAPTVVASGTTFASSRPAARAATWSC